MTVFVEKQDSENAYRLLHALVVEDEIFSSLSLGDDASMITIVSPEFTDENPGIISNITEPLRINNINIIEIASSQTAVVVYVDIKDGQKAYDLLVEVLE